MTDKEILEGNDKIEKHNKFCFMKKPMPLYKKAIPLSVPLTYAIVSFTLLALPSFF